MSQHNTEPKSWLIRVHQKINDGMVDSSPRLAWLRSKFGVMITSLLLAVIACNWVVIYGVPVEAMPAWFSWLAQWVVETIPGAKANVLHSWYLRDIFPYIYTVNLSMSFFTCLVAVVATTYKEDQPFIRVKGIRNIAVFHLRYLVMAGLSILLALSFYWGMWLEPVFEAKPLPNTSAGGAAIKYRMFETHFGALLMYSLVVGWGMPLISGLSIQIIMRWYLSAFRVFYFSLFKKELSK